MQCVELLECLDGGAEWNYAPDCMRGMAFGRWVSKNDFVEFLANCTEPCIEVFWRSPLGKIAYQSRRNL
jgi:hypothetical protein